MVRIKSIKLWYGVNDLIGLMKYLSREHNLKELNIICLKASIWFDALLFKSSYGSFRTTEEFKRDASGSQ